MVAWTLDKRDIRAFTILAIFITLLAGIGVALLSRRAVKAQSVNRLLETGSCNSCDLDGVSLRQADLANTSVRDASLREVDFLGRRSTKL